MRGFVEDQKRQRTGEYRTARTRGVAVVNVRNDAYEVYAGRTERYFPAGQTSRWGNPFVIGKPGGRDTVVAAHRLLLAVQIWRGEVSEADLLGLDGCRVGCHCAPQPCHVDNLVDAVRAATEGCLREWANRVIERADRKLRKTVEEYCKTTRGKRIDETDLPQPQR